MCDYSLEHTHHRDARVGDRLVSTQFANSYTRGFASAGDLDVEVCLLPGTEFVFEDEVQCDRALGFYPPKRLKEKMARFRKINAENPHEHHDALEFASGQIVLLTRLRVGQRATVLQLPATVNGQRTPREAATPATAAPREPAPGR